MQNSTKAHLALLGANIIYGANYIIAKGVMPEKINPTAVVVIRLACCTLLFWLIKLLFVKEAIKRRDVLRLALCGLLGAAANQLLFFHGINLTSPIDASIIMTITPVIVLIFSFIILKERITKNKIIGITIGGIGAITLILYGNSANGTSSLLGNLLVFLNASSYGLYLVVAKTLMKKYNPITVISWVFLFGFIYVLPFGFTDLVNTNFEAFTLNTYLVIGYIVLFTTFLAYLFNLFALGYLSPSVNSSYIYLQPAVSFIMVSIFAYVLMNNQYSQDIGIVKILSCLLVILGVYITSKSEKATT
ncbi:DMT family transporter [Siansivirga zeaxanthinifaciens]|uniref:Transmembrane permease n=1 Tax=Siansivirga zeaxanthinifaciens CC-SAMT-1 TaxID=1454006 RepID=A0A0C5W8Q4_9FLAO|nr:EamA family transporter [Siansivirga zeaxanthinifaciens]AJR02647.1 transmembrane permease [Siansivirga zeaxanthinifaciens CC-SAMT-1]